MNLTDEQRNVLESVCVRPGGVDIHEAMILTDLDYKTIVGVLHQLIAKGYQIRALTGSRNPDAFIKRIFISPYDPKIDQLIKK